MAYRTVFKLIGSFGPGGSVAILTEKVCRQMFFEAYDMGDPEREQVQESEKKMQEQRAAYV